MRLPTLTIRAARLLAVLWTLALAVGFSLPSDELPMLTPFGADKVLHLVGFAAFAVLWLEAGASRRRVLIAGALFGILSEVYQHVMPIGRIFSPYDALADLVGLGLGVLLHARLRRAASPNIPPSP